MADNNIFVYTGREQVVPRNITHVVIDRSVKIILERAFEGRQQLVTVETHVGIKIIERWAFRDCRSLRGIKLPGVTIIEREAFWGCHALSDVKFGDRLETIEELAFNGCRSLQKIEMPSVRTIGPWAFEDCMELTDVELPAVESFEPYAFNHCHRLRRIAIPLKDNMFPLDTFYQRCTQFDYCGTLTTVDLVGVEGMYKTISSLLLESWRDEMNQEIDRINQVLPNSPATQKTDTIQRWIRSVINRMEHYKDEHNSLLKEDMTQLELAVWKAKLDMEEGDNSDFNVKVPAKKAKIDMISARKELRIISGADIIIKNVLPFLQLLE